MDDLDNDGLSNIEEFTYGSDPSNRDTDGDGMDDFYEISNGYGVNNSDGHWDQDDDFLDNIWEYRLRALGAGPDTSLDAIFAGIVVILSSALVVYLVRNVFAYVQAIMDERNFAKIMGFSSLRDKRKAEKLGFMTAYARNQAQQLGYGNKFIEDILPQYDVKTVSELDDNWTRSLQETNNQIQSFNNYLSVSIAGVKTPSQLSTISADLDAAYQSLLTFIPFHQRLNQSIAQIKQITVSSGEFPLFQMTRERFDSYEIQNSKIISKINELSTNISQRINKKSQFLSIWTPMLELLKITEDNVPTSLQKITQIVNTNEEHARTILVSILEEYPMIGRYDTENELYTKGINVEHYIVEALKRVKHYNKKD
jgi:hypothetical protein